MPFPLYAHLLSGAPQDIDVALNSSPTSWHWKKTQIIFSILTTISQPFHFFSKAPFALSQARLPGTDYRLGPISNLQLGKDIRDVVAYGLRTKMKLLRD